MAQNAQNCSIQREMQKQPKIFKKCQVGEAASIWPLKASKLDLHGNFYLTKLVSKYIHNRIIYKEKWCHSNIHSTRDLHDRALPAESTLLTSILTVPVKFETSIDDSR